MPGAVLRLSMAHLGLSQRVPFRYSLTPSRRHSLQTGSVILAMIQRALVFTGLVWAGLDAPLLGRAAAVVGQRGDVLDGLDVQAGRLQGGDGRLAARPGALDAHLDLF